MSNLPSRLLTGLLAGLLAAAPAAASFHLVRITQVYGGDESHPDAQYIELRMCTLGQNFVATHPVTFYDAAGQPIGSATFASSLPNGDSQARIFVATSTAEIAFGLAADLRIPARLTLAGGKVCFDPAFPPNGVDCFAWGNYSNLPDPAVGNPFDPLGGLPDGDAPTRDLAVDGGATTLECNPAGDNDDTDDSASDFDAMPPIGANAPGNNAGALGALDADLVFVHGFEAESLAGWSASVP